MHKGHVPGNDFIKMQIETKNKELENKEMELTEKLPRSLSREEYHLILLELYNYDRSYRHLDMEDNTIPTSFPIECLIRIINILNIQGF